MIDCDTSGTVPENDGRVVRGTRMFRTQSEEYARIAAQAEFGDSEEERQKARKRLEHISRWEHYCPDHAVAIGIAPEHVAQETRYKCEQCGAVNDGHKTKPSGHGRQAACLDCGATALRRIKEVDVDE